MLERLRLGPRLRAHLSSPPVLWAIGLTLVAITVRVPVLGSALVAPDTADYLARMELLLEGEGFQNALRTPAFILLLAGFDLLGADPVVAVVLLQNVVGILLPAAVLLVGWRFFNPATGAIAGFLAAASPLLLISEQYALTDYLFGVLLFIGAALLAEGALRTDLGRPASRWLIASGAAFGLATLFRGNGQFLIAAIPIALLLALRDWRRTLRSAALAVAAMLIVLAPWVVHNVVRFGTPQVTTLGGYALYLRAVDHDRIPPPDDSADGRLARRIYNQVYALAPPDQELNSGLLLAEALERRGDDNVAVSSAMTRLAVEAISEDPSTYSSNTWDILREYRTMYDPGHELLPGLDDGEFVRSIFLAPGVGNAIEGRSGALPADSTLTRSPWDLAEVVAKLIFLFSIGGLLALVLPFVGPRRSRVGASVLLPIVLIGSIVGALSIHFEPRYDLPFAELTWLLMAAAAVGLARLLAAALGAIGGSLLSSGFVHDLRNPERVESQSG